jgi:hypothetical protein
MPSSDTPNFSSPEEVTLALEKLAKLVGLSRTDPDAYRREVERMFPRSKTGAVGPRQPN